MLAVRPRVVCRCEHHDLVSAEGNGMDARVFDIMGQDCDVSFKCQQLLLGGVRVAQDHADLDIGIAGQETGHHFGRVEGADRRQPQMSDGQLATGLHQILGLFMQAHDAAAQIEQRCTGIRQLHPTSATDQQLDPIAVFQLFDLSGDGRLADVQSLGGGGETTVLGDGMKRAELRKDYSHRL